MNRVWVLALLAVVGCSEKQAGSVAQDQKATAAVANSSEKQAGSAAQDQKATAALANKDEQCPGGTVKGCFDAAVEAERKEEIARAVELHSRVCDAGVARALSAIRDGRSVGEGGDARGGGPDVGERGDGGHGCGGEESLIGARCKACSCGNVAPPADRYPTNGRRTEGASQCLRVVRGVG